MVSIKAEQRLAQEIAEMTRLQIIYQLTHFEGSVRLDFTEEFLAQRSREQLGHILLAARLHISPQTV